MSGGEGVTERAQSMPNAGNTEGCAALSLSPSLGLKQRMLRAALRVTPEALKLIAVLILISILL